MSEYRLTESDVIIRVLDNANIPNDPMNADRISYNEWLSAGNTPDPYVPVVLKVTVVTPRQARLALLQAGLLDQVEAAVNQAGGATKITWDYATEINRADPMIETIAQSLNLSDEQIDELFTIASTL